MKNNPTMEIQYILLKKAFSGRYAEQMQNLGKASAQLGKSVQVENWNKNLIKAFKNYQDVKDRK